MYGKKEVPSRGSDATELARKCLTLISTIAVRGANSDNPEHIGYAMQELSQVLLERTGIQDRLFEPVASNQITGLSSVLSELQFVDDCAIEMSMPGTIQFRLVPVQ